MAVATAPTEARGSRSRADWPLTLATRLACGPLDGWGTIIGDSPFLDIAPSDYIAENETAFAIRDKHPVTPGHALVVPRRLIATWWEASEAERADIWRLVDEVKQVLDGEVAPDGYNVGFNAGPAAGQTVNHLHVHVIPRHIGDVDDPRGGVRHVIPSRGNYLLDGQAGEQPALVDGLEGTLLPHLLHSLRDQSIDRIDIVVSFVRRSGLDLVLPDLLDALDRDAVIRLLTTDYLGITEPAALERLHDVVAMHRDRGQISVKVFRDPSTSFHPKAYLFSSSSDEGRPRQFVGSSNLTRSGLDGGVEWNVRTTATEQAVTAFERLWTDRRSVRLSRSIIDRIKSMPRPQTTMPLTAAESLETAVDESDAFEPATPHGVQAEALDALDGTRAAGHQAGLVVMATGLGKTYLAAFDALAVRAERVLFVAHRREILQQARDSFRQVMPEARMGLLVDGQDDSDAPVLFASVPSLVRRLDTFEPKAFDYLVVDEFHHAWADSYREIIDHFEPLFLLGLTATPERMDGGDILRLCGDNEVFRCDLIAGIERKLLCPFQYHGVLDPTDYAVVPWRRGRFDADALEVAVATEQRAQRIFDEWSARRGTRTLAFCVSQRHADFMAAWFRDHGVRAAAVHSGPTSAPRHESVRQLTDGELDVLFSVDVFNEGFDVPQIDTVLMLRPTESPVVFLQQLGRGLRTAEGKHRLVVIDLIGNHASFLLKPRILISLAQGRPPTTQAIIAALEESRFDLPADCNAEFDIEVIDLLKKLAERSSKAVDVVADYVLSHVAEEGTRPSKVQVFRAGLNPDAPRRPWFEYLDGLDVLQGEEVAALRECRSTLDDLERKVLANATKSYKLVTLQVLLRRQALRSGLPIDEVVRGARSLMVSDPRLLGDVATRTFPDPQEQSHEAWRALWEKNPISALTTPTRGVRLFEVRDDRLVPTFDVTDADGTKFDRMVAELVDYRLAKYLVDQSEGYVLKVSNSGRAPIVRYDRARHPRLPQGDNIPFEADGITYYGDFRKIALNVARRADSDANDLHELLRGWFGPNAGAPGTAHHVILKDTGLTWEMKPAVGREGGGWSADQVDAVVDHYFQMLDDELAGRPYVKAEHNRAIQAVTGRPRGAIEFKLANISAVLRDLHQPFIDGYKPRGNYQADLREAVERRLRELAEG